MSSLSSTPTVQLDRDASVALARFAFGADSGDDSLAVPLALLAGAPQEPWLASRPVQQLRTQDGIRVHENGDWLIGELRVEAALSEHIEQAAFEAYTRLRAFVAASAYPQLLRVWNFFARLNEGVGDDERYRRFCVGRHRAIAAPGFEAQLPAATVIGTQVPGLVIQFLAGRSAGTQVENPRQTPAFRYPRDYGPISPSFSRATRVGEHLLVSGTAAVVGHATLHPGDAVAQIDEIDANVAALLDHAAAGQAGAWQAQALRLYVRRESDQARVLPRVLQRFGEHTPITVLRGDISRADLMVEIEGVWSLR